MPDLCSGNSQEIQLFYDNLYHVDIIVVFILIALCALTSTIASLFIFCARSSDQRPLFVTLQMILLNLFWIIFLSYWITVAKADTDRQMVD